MQSFSPAFRGAENLDLKKRTKCLARIARRQVQPIAGRHLTGVSRPSSGSKTTLSCSLGSVREMTAVAGSVWLML
jgi:hypothetical protein